MARRLAPNGVYVTWVDSRIGDVGVDIVLETLAQTFGECWLSFMSGEYYMLACASERVTPGGIDAVASNEVLGDYLAEEHQLPARLIPYHVISTRALDLRSGRAPVNRLDFPILEFEMARLSEESFEGFTRRLEETIDLGDVRRRLQAHMAWRPAEFALGKDLRLGRSSRLGELLQDAVAERFPTELDYEAGALQLAAEVGSGDAFYKYGKRLLGRNYAAGAVVAFERALALETAAVDVRYNLGRALYGVGRWEEALVEFLDQWQLDEDARAPLAVVRTLIELGRLPEALEWLARAEEVEPDRSEVPYYRGVVLEGSEDFQRAVMCYRRALSLDPGNELAQDALARLSLQPASSSEHRAPQAPGAGSP